MYPLVTSKVLGDVVGIVCSYIYIYFSILFCLSPELQLHQLLSYRQLPLIIVVDLWLVLEFFLFSFFFFWCLALCHMTFGNSGLGVFLALVLLTAVSGEESPCSSSCFSPSSYFKFNTTPLLARAV